MDLSQIGQLNIMKRASTREHSSPLRTRREIIVAASSVFSIGSVSVDGISAARPARTQVGLDGGAPPKAGVSKGKFGAALNAAWSGAQSARVVSAYKSFPLTVEFWCKLEPEPLTYNFLWSENILVANEPRESADHWAIFLDTMWSTGVSPTEGYGALCVYLPGMKPETVKSRTVVADGHGTTWPWLSTVNALRCTSTARK